MPPPGVDHQRLPTGCLPSPEPVRGTGNSAPRDLVGRIGIGMGIRMGMRIDLVSGVSELLYNLYL